MASEALLEKLDAFFDADINEYLSEQQRDRKSVV